MDKKEAIEVIRNNWPDSRYSMLREALDIAITVIEESMVQKPATNTARDEICPVCTGDGIGADASEWVKCPTCNGTGKLSPIA